MAARSAVPASYFARDGSLTDPAGTAVDSTNGNTIAAPGPFKVILRVTNTAGNPYNVIVRATGSGVTAAGATQTNPVPSNVVFAQSTVGDLTVAVAATSGVQWIGPITSDRFAQSDGSLSVDYSNTSFAGKITAFVLPGTTGMAGGRHLVTGVRDGWRPGRRLSRLPAMPRRTRGRREWTRSRGCAAPAER